MLGCLGIFIGIVLALWIWLGPVLSAGQKAGVFQPQKKTDYHGTNTDNLKAIHQALLMYQESEGALPLSETWMDALWPYLQTADLKEGEAEKKLRSPAAVEANRQAYGYAFNPEAQGANLTELETTPGLAIVFDSSDLSRNAFGNPAQLAPSPERPGGNLAVTPSGQVKRLADLLHH